MGDQLYGVPIPFWVAGLTGLGIVLAWFGKRLLALLQGEREWSRDEVRQLRKALDRLRRRENAYATGFEIVLLAIPAKLTRDQRRAVQRARQLFESALIHPDPEGEG